MFSLIFSINVEKIKEINKWHVKQSSMISRGKKMINVRWWMVFYWILAPLINSWFQRQNGGHNFFFYETVKHTLGYRVTRVICKAQGVHSMMRWRAWATASHHRWNTWPVHALFTPFLFLARLTHNTKPSV